MYYTILTDHSQRSRGSAPVASPGDGIIYIWAVQICIWFIKADHTFCVIGSGSGRLPDSGPVPEGKYGRKCGISQTS